MHDHGDVVRLTDRRHLYERDDEPDAETPAGDAGASARRKRPAHQNVKQV
jgi:hypothetical protein